MSNNGNGINLVGGGVLSGVRGSDLKAYRKKIEKDTLKQKRGIEKPIYWVSMRLRHMRFNVELFHYAVKYFIVTFFKKQLG